jgi:D-beta-D-heptose 7-phosphate kinase/D-beta-D-heptose 1-phosphate adenosyltransferase
MTTKLPLPRVRQLLSAFNRARVTVLGDVMLDQFLWGSVARLSPEAPRSRRGI